MKILLMGGSVFVGRAILERLKMLGADVTAITRGAINADWEGVTHIRSDRKDLSRLTRDLEGKSFDAVVDVSCYTPLDMHNLMSALGARISKYVLISSAAVYNRNISCLPFKENSSLGGDEIWGEYGIDKFHAEEILLNNSIDSIQRYIFRPPYIFGPNNNLARESFLWARISTENPIFIPGNGETLLQFCYVDDLAKAVGDAVMANNIPPGIYNVGEGTFYTLNQYIQLLARIAKKNVTTISVINKTIKAREYFPFRENHLILDTSRFEAIGSTAFTSLEAGLRTTYKILIQTGALKLEYTPAEAELINQHSK